MNKWRSTKYSGIRFYYHKTRKHGIKFDLERLKRTLQDSGKSPRTIQYIFATVRGTWNMARKHRVIEGDSPTKAVKKPKVENKRVRFLTTQEAQTLLEELERRDLATYRMAAISL